MPVMADEEGEIGAVKLTNKLGNTALLASTGIDSLTAWDSRARPVPGRLPDLAATVTEVAFAGLASGDLARAGHLETLLRPGVALHLGHG